MEQSAATDRDPTLARLPESARMWLFGADRELEPAEERRLLGEVEAFLDRWKAHGHEMAAAFEWREGRFLIVGADDRVTVPSGCSIDALVRRLRDLERELEVALVGSAPVWYRDGSGIRRVSRARFRELAADGAVDAETTVYDMSLTRLSQLREGRWKLPAGESWHARYLPDAPGSSTRA